MAIRFKKSGPRQRHFVAAWRRHRELSQEQLAEDIGTTAATLSRIENLVIPYNQDFIEACAKVLRCTPADLVGRDPRAPDFITTLWERVLPAEQPRALKVLRAFAGDPVPTEEPAPRPAAKRGRR